MRPFNKINEKIGELVGKGLSADVIMALDVLRVTGNNAAHPAGSLLPADDREATPGTLRIDDDNETANALFQIINYIVEQTISHKKRLEEMHDRFPEGIRKQIERRNERSAPKA